MTLILLFLISIQVFYWYYFFNSVGSTTPLSSKNADFPPFSLIICVKDELANLTTNLPYIVNQIRPVDELIVANDFSSDGTSEFLKEIDNELPYLKPYEVKQNKPGKKQALKEAMDFSRHKWSLLTDADCQPGPLWARNMLHMIKKPNIKVVLGYSPIIFRESLISHWCHFETWIIAIQYLSYAVRGRPYMGVGRNLLYDKDLLSSDTITKYDSYSSGDDDLTIMQIANGSNTAIVMTPDSFVYTEAPPNWKAYLRQKRRHYSTAVAYKLEHKVLLGLFSLTQVSYYAVLIYCLLAGNLFLPIALYILRMVLVLPVMFKLRMVLLAKFNLIQFLFFDFMLALHYVFFSFAVLVPQKNKW